MSEAESGRNDRNDRNDQNAGIPVEQAQENLVRFIMPSEGDMELVDQKGGTLLLKPFYFSGECAGPIVQFVTRANGETKVSAAYRLKIRNREIRLAKAD